MTAVSATAINPEILNLISKNNIATVCCSDNDKPYCFSCFYSTLEEDACIVFKSSDSTRHMKILAENNLVAGTIIPFENSMTKVIGIQFEGIMVEKETTGIKAAKSYYMHYPFAVAVPCKIWVIEFNSIKYTSTINGIKHKLEWER